jgi:hypothetical protein
MLRGTGERIPCGCGRAAEIFAPQPECCGLNGEEATRCVAVFLIDPSTRPTASLRMTNPGSQM